MSATRAEGPLPGWQPPALSRRLTDPIPIAVGGTLICVTATVVFGALALTGLREADIWLESSVCGIGVGLLGLAVITYQSRARRRAGLGASLDP